MQSVWQLAQKNWVVRCWSV